MGKPQIKNKPLAMPRVIPTEVIEEDEIGEVAAETEGDVTEQTVNAETVSELNQEPETAPVNPWQAPEARPVTTLTASLPIATPKDYPDGGAQSKRITHVDLQLSRRQAEALRFLFCGIEQVSHLRLNNGRPICTQHDAIRWLLDQVADQVPECNAVTPISNWDG